MASHRETYKQFAEFFFEEDAFNLVKFQNKNKGLVEQRWYD